MQIGEVSAEITADVTEFNKALNKLQQDAIKFGNQIGVNLNKGISQTKPTGFQNFNKQLESVSKSMVKVGKDMTLKLTLPIVAAGTMATKTFADFELAMNRVAAISGATGNDLEKLTKIARDLGYTTEFSASQVAEAMGNLALAGFSVNEIYDASEGVLQLASSALLDMGTSASIVSNVIRGYGIDISELNNAIDVLVKGFTSANMDLRMLGESLQYVGPIASSAGLSFNEVVAVIGNYQMQVFKVHKREQL
jgi:Phage-related minor tail protein.